MVVQEVPLFAKGQILRQTMLRGITEQAFGFGKLLYDSFSDGILSGCTLTTTAKTIEVSPGIIICGGTPFLLHESLTISYRPTNSLCIFKLRFSDECKTTACMRRELECFLTEDRAERKNEMELCRFKLQPGAQLRYEYVDFEDRNTEYDTLNTIHAPFAAYGENTLSPEIVRSFARELLEMGPLDTLDQMFCIQMMGAQSPQPRDAIAAYIKIRSGHLEEPYTNETLFEGLLAILQNNKCRSPHGDKRAEQRRWHIILD